MSNPINELIEQSILSHTEDLERLDVIASELETSINPQVVIEDCALLIEAIECFMEVKQDHIAALRKDLANIEYGQGI